MEHSCLQVVAQDGIIQGKSVQGQLSGGNCPGGNYLGIMVPKRKPGRQLSLGKFHRQGTIVRSFPVGKCPDTCQGYFMTTMIMLKKQRAILLLFS